MTSLREKSYRTLENRSNGSHPSEVIPVIIRHKSPNETESDFLEALDDFLTAIGLTAVCFFTLYVTYHIAVWVLR